MANRWGIPSEVEKLVRDRDSRCIYCRTEFSISKESRKSRPTWEHIINDIRINGIENIALCCTSCNASKGEKNWKSGWRANFVYQKKSQWIQWLLL